MTDPHDAPTVPSSLFMNTIPSGLHPQEPATPSIHDMPLRFTGSGSEYFRIWIVNLLLTLVTLTLYWPFARARRMAYFHSNTWVGNNALGFHADPWKMFRGYLLMLGLGLVYWLVSYFVPALSWLPLLVLALLWPALWRSSLMFRLRNTSWCGVRFDFAGSSRDAYRVMLPLWIPSVLLVALVSLAEAPGWSELGWVQSLLAIAGVLMAVFLLLFPWLMARMHAYQHSGYVFTAERAHLPVSALTGALYLLGLKAFGLMLLVSVLMGVVVAMFGAGGVMAGVAVAVGAVYLVFPLVLLPYWKTRMQNLVWGQTRSRHIALSSALRFRDFFKLNVLNWLLIVLTLGLYWPFAAIRTARLRLEAMSVRIEGDVSTWVAQAPAQRAGVLGDAAGDFFGVDMGL
jgi:uncharacterized membrane protein YjgN (DUF898 family)